ncbi:efflux RND transporter periplasmic adaptor subunit [Flavisolibacter sp. BT320]|nr:efflux RND transporter periplasmic adaptor subunit [Flavisolibacter longurius]
MKKTTRWILLLLGALVLFILLTRTVFKKDGEGTKVTAETIKRRTIVETVSASGKIYPETEIKVGSPVSGEVVQLSVQEGDTVQKGKILARIQGERNTAAQRISVPNVPPGFEGLLQNMQPPRSSGPSSATIKAPISGTITALNAKQGERVGAMQMPGSELLRIADMNNIEVRVDVNENNIIKISIGDSADVEVEAYNKRKFKGIVTAIANGGTKREAQSFLSNDITSYEVRIRLLPATYADLYDSTKPRSMPFRPGMNARADIKTRKREDVLAVPVGAVVSKPKGEEGNSSMAKVEGKEDVAGEETGFSEELEEVVYVIKQDGSVEKRVVVTGIQDINYFEITSGIKEGERVVSGPYSAVSKTLRSGNKVKVVSKDKLFQNE